MLEHTKLRALCHFSDDPVLCGVGASIVHDNHLPTYILLPKVSGDPGECFANALFLVVHRDHH
jgi:hypothetical protein